MVTRLKYKGRTSFVDLATKSGQNSSVYAKLVRENLKQHFNNEDSVPWQWEIVDTDGRE